MIETTGGGLVIPEGDIAGMAATVAALRTDPKERERLAREGRAGVERHFAPRVAARELDQLLRWALQG